MILALGDYMNITCHAFIGGNSVQDDIKRLELGTQIVVGTPGRIFDMISRGALRKSSTRNINFDFSMLNSFRYQTYKSPRHG